MQPEDQIDIIADDVRKLKRAVQEVQLNGRELIWANVFHDTICESKWLLDKSLSLGRAAIGYNFAYVLYRCLNEVHPEYILEIGLGQSTQIVMQYMKNQVRGGKGKHIVVEQEKSWTEFWKNTHELGCNSEICHLPVYEEQYKECQNVLRYRGFEKFADTKWNLILVDGPAHTKSEIYARIDLLSILPEGLAEEWIIMFDDIDRTICANGLEEIKSFLTEKGIDYCMGLYKGKKDVAVLCSMSLQYITTL